MHAKRAKKHSYNVSILRPDRLTYMRSSLGAELLTKVSPCMSFLCLQLMGRGSARARAAQIAWGLTDVRTCIHTMVISWLVFLIFITM